MIPVTYIRSSSYSTHEMCEMKYFGEYVLGWSGLSNKAADCGTIVHKTMEILAEINLARLAAKDFIVDDIVGQISCSDVEPLDIMDKVYQHYSYINDHHIWSSVDYKKCAKWTTMTLEYRDGCMNPLNQNIIKPEQHFDIEVKEDWAKYEYELDGQIISDSLRLKGTIDLITKIDSNTHEIVDYKSGARKNWKTNNPKEYEDFLKDFQLRLYHYAHMVLYPHIENVLITIFYIRDGGPFTIALGRQDIPDTIDMIRKKFEYIRQTQNPKTEYGSACRFCPLAKTTFEKTNIKPIPKDLNPDTKFKYIDSKYMCKCDQLKYVLKHRSIEDVIINMTKDGYSISKYKAPGET